MNRFLALSNLCSGQKSDAQIGGGCGEKAIPKRDLAIVIFGGNYHQANTHLVKKDHIPNDILRSLFLRSGEWPASTDQAPEK